jgi:hypothetical protein
MTSTLPSWASEMRDLFRAGASAQFILHGNIFDAVPQDGKMLAVRSFLDEVMFAGYDVVLHYDRSRGIRAVKGGEDWGEWLRGALGDDSRNQSYLREPGAALELIDRYLLRTLNLQAINDPKAKAQKLAVVIDFAEFVVPRGDAVSLGGAFSANVVKVLGWANDPSIMHANIVTVLLTEGLNDLNELVAQNPHAVTLHVPLPDEAEMREYLDALVKSEFPDLPARSDVPIDALARRLTGISRVGARRVLALALKGGERITAQWLSRMKKETIERECQGLLEFIESDYTLDNVAGLDAVRSWLREDAELLRRGALRALPMGYLIAGRIGTGKTFLVTCWAGELGIPCVVFKNFRDRWVGATETNLEKIFAVLRALGQVVVFVDEADQAAGKREGGDGDSGLSGRVYSMLAKEMSDTRNRGKIIWVFATSRPDLLEVDLKRQGRLDVHIPLFPPETTAERRALLLAVAKKIQVPLGETDLPELPEHLTLGGNEIEGVFVRGLRTWELSAEPRRPLREILVEVFRDVRPSAHTRKLEFMDLVAVKECTDVRFLPARYRDLAPEAIEQQIEELRRFI